MEKGFVEDVKQLRRRAREHIERGAVTEAYHADREEVVRLLNGALATELVCVLRYKRHYFAARGIHAESVIHEFLEHARQEQEHADQIARRIAELGGEPNFNPDGLTARSRSQYVEAGSLLEMIRENIVAERIAIESYTEIIRHIGDKDPTTRRMLEEILAHEEEHAHDLVNIYSRSHAEEPPRRD